MRVLALAALSTVLAGCATSDSSSAETIPPDVLAAEDEHDETGGLFRHCRAVHRDDSTDDVTCAGYAIEVRKRDETSFEPILDAYIQANVYAKTSREAGYDTELSTYQLRVGKDKWPGRSYRMKQKMTGGSAETGFIVVGQNSGGQTYSISCSGKLVADRDANLANDCKAAMTHILMSGVPERLFEAK